MKRSEVRILNGQHCESTATGTLLRQCGFELSEAMLFGLGEGLGFVYWNSKHMEFPFLGGRVKPQLLTSNLCANLGVTCRVFETGSPEKGWNAVKDVIDRGNLVGLKLDSYYLEYFTKPIHFAGHYVALYDYDDRDAYLVDTQQQGGFVKTSLESLAAARSAKGQMASRHLYYTIEADGPRIDVEAAIVRAIRNNANDFLSPPIANVGYKGIRKAAAELPKAFAASVNVERDFGTLALVMEKAGTGGALFRAFYRDFLRESAEALANRRVRAVADEYERIAADWTRVSQELDRAGKTKDASFVASACRLLVDLSERERTAMELLAAETNGIDASNGVGSGRS